MACIATAKTLHKKHVFTDNAKTCSVCFITKTLNDKHKTRMEVEDILEARNKLVFHNDSEDDKLQLVIVRR